MMIKRMLFLVVAILVFATGCGGTGGPPQLDNPVPSPKNAMETMTIYSISTETMSLMPVYVRKPKKKVSAEDIVLLVMENLSENDIREPELQKNGKSLIISFSSKGEPVKNCDKQMEHLILECFANSILENIQSVYDIIFRVDNRAYKSKNYEFGKNDIFTSR